ncbi:MBL fold metallo-hydrolase [Tissierella carlieri]|jgi:metallo-beta-lactamase family protein|uniref:MBL fold metallo-hydrolase n=1 Tax=Tissierella carlieri TaxID=689904 RepID=A0ABT1SG98_9FIRM|nr:MBL fold metallo-hydrolase [Tissierella carlieri]MBU5313382.1 MBL fold metallo-hydrolase [Tissierella carlieri]MCQ4925511.1 MBL fold metallo-hydrolase [Tissierella carlieri]MDU5082667.1 MBL fold metallo-hydrolase [Bacillota bacterium]
MDIQFYGAAKMVTGSNYLVKTEKYNILVDCGMFQGNEEMEKLNYNNFPYNPSEIDFLILTHAHIDHSGRIPKLVKDGFRGRIITTNATYDLCKIMLKDSAKIQESDVEWENRKRQRAGKKPIEPLYTMKDAENSLKYFEPYFIDQKIKINDNIQIRFKDAGHILGSAILELWVREVNEEVKVVFSGDLGMPGRPIINSPDYIDEADYLVIESTYGDTIHESYEESTEKLIDIINKTVLRGGTVIIPSFAVGRTQELIYKLNKYYEYNPEVEEYMKVPIYIDSPMAVDATEAFKRNSSSFNDEARALILKGDNPFQFSNLRYIKSQEESMALNKYTFPKVIISSSGMATAGRIRHHLKHNLWDEKNSLVFVGYQAEGTLGRILLDGKRQVKILGEEIHVRAQIYDIKGFSGHADQNMLLDWINKFKKKPKKIFVVHGEEEPANALSTLIRHLYKIETIIPNINDSFSIAKNEVELTKGIEILPEMLREDIENELKTAYNQFEALINKSSEMVDDKLLTKKYDEIKNRLIDLQHRLMDLNIIVGK